MSKRFTTAVTIASISMTVSMLTAFMMMQRAPTVVTFDVKSTLENYQQALIKKDLSLDQQTARLTHFADIMSQEVQAYHIKHNAIVVVDAAIVGGAIDITPQIQQAIIQRYQKE